MTARCFDIYLEKTSSIAIKNNGMRLVRLKERFAALALLLIACMLLPSNITAAQVSTVDTTTVSAKAQGSIDFKLNFIDFDSNYHDNSAQLDSVLEKIDAMVLDPHLKVERMIVTGTASPEGPYDNNVRLATNRAKALINILKKRYSFPDSIFAVSTIPEDWEGMRVMLTANPTIPYRAEVLDYLDNSAHLDADARESQLKGLDGGRPYASMLGNVLPYLRRATVEVHYDATWLQRHQMTQAGPEAIHPTADIPQLPEASILPIAPVRSKKNRFFALKTNLLGDAALCANLGFELELWHNWSIDVPVWYSPYDITDRWRIRLLAMQPELRYWPKNAGMGHYFGIHTSIVGFNVSFNGDYRYQDPNHAAFGVGVGYGYAFHLDKKCRWNLEAQIGAGYIGYKWIKYHNIGRNGAEVSRGSGTYWGITSLGVTLSYKFYTQRKGRRWMKW